MIAETGHFALILALCIAIVQTVMPLVGAHRREASWMAVAAPAATEARALQMRARPRRAEYRSRPPLPLGRLSRLRLEPARVSPSRLDNHPLQFQAQRPHHR